MLRGFPGNTTMAEPKRGESDGKHQRDRSHDLSERPVGLGCVAGGRRFLRCSISAGHRRVTDTGEPSFSRQQLTMCERSVELRAGLLERRRGSFSACAVSSADALESMRPSAFMEQHAEREHIRTGVDRLAADLPGDM
jgi:hypothetical protein